MTIIANRDLLKTPSMDLALDYLDERCFDALYLAVSPDWLGVARNDAVRQSISIYMIVALGNVF